MAEAETGYFKVPMGRQHDWTGENEVDCEGRSSEMDGDMVL